MTKWLMIVVLMGGCVAEVDYSGMNTLPENVPAEDALDAGDPIHDKEIKADPKKAIHLVLGAPR